MFLNEFAFRTGIAAIGFRNQPILYPLRGPVGTWARGCPWARGPEGPKIVMEGEGGRQRTQIRHLPGNPPFA